MAGGALDGRQHELVGGGIVGRLIAVTSVVLGHVFCSSRFGGGEERRSVPASARRALGRAGTIGDASRLSNSVPGPGC